MFKKTKKVFLDYASTTPVDKKAFQSMKPYFSKDFFNPSAIYRGGVTVSKVLEKCHQEVSRIIQSKPTEIIFTGSGTESDNMAILGVARGIISKKENSLKGKPHIITTAIEHVAVLDACRQLEVEGFDVTYLKPDEKGIISPERVIKQIRPETILISIMLANNEIGTILPIRKISVAVKKNKKSENKIVSDYPFFHTDASQAPNYLRVNVDALGVDLMTLDGSKIYGPKGVGILFSKSYVPICPISFGGGQERGKRAGTENVPAIIGFTKALQIASAIRKKESERMKKLQKLFLELLEKEIPSAEINGSIKNRMPNNINICIKGLDAEFAVLQLDEIGISCAAMSACKNLTGGVGSYVVKALTKKNDTRNCAKSSLRFSMGRKTSAKDIKLAITALKQIIKSQI